MYGAHGVVVRAFEKVGRSTRYHWYSSHELTVMARKCSSPSGGAPISSVVNSSIGGRVLMNSWVHIPVRGSTGGLSIGSNIVLRQLFKEILFLLILYFYWFDVGWQLGKYTALIFLRSKELIFKIKLTTQKISY